MEVREASCVLTNVEKSPCSLLLASIPTSGTSGWRPRPEGSAVELAWAMKKNVWRAIIEVGFIIILFYSNLLMGEFERSGIEQKRGVAGAIADVFTAADFELPW